MAKKTNMTDAQVAEITSKTSDIHFDIADIADEIRAGRCDELSNPIQYARDLASLARVAADAATAILSKAAMQADRDALRKELEARAGK